MDNEEQLLTTPDLAEQAQQGELTPSEQGYGEKNENLPPMLKSALKDLVRHFGGQEMYPRRFEIKEAQKQRNFWRGMQHFLWDARECQWRLPNDYQNSGPSTSATSNQDDPRSETNIYYGYGKQIVAALTQSTPSVRFEPEDPLDSQDIQAAYSAEKMRRVIYRDNKILELLTDIARFLWTDGRVAVYTRWVTDGQRFGFEEEEFAVETPEGENQSQVGARTPRGQEVMTAYGALEVKLPISQNDLDDCPYLQLNQEQDITSMKALYPQIAEKISAATVPVGESEYERVTRVSINQGTRQNRTTGEANQDLVSYQRTWLRPSTFYRIEDVDVRNELLTLFPDGVMVAYAGDTYCEARSESINDHWAIMHALPGDGMHRMSLGGPLVSLQERLNDLMDIAQNTYDATIPVKWVNAELIDLDALSEQERKPGGYLGIKPQAGMDMGYNFFIEPTVDVPVSMVTMIQQLKSDIAQFLSGAFPALFGGNTGSNDTAQGIMIQRDQALGGLGITWRPLKELFAQITLQAVQVAANCRERNIATNIPPVKGGQSETITIDLTDLAGNITCYPETDEGFPESWTSQRATYMNLAMNAEKNPAMGALLFHPDNLAYAKRVIGLEDLVIPQADSRNKQLKEIDELLKGTPLPNPKLVQAQQQLPQIQQQAASEGQQIPPQMMQQIQQQMAQLPPLISSVPIDDQFDDHEVEYTEVGRWINSPEGQKTKLSNPPGFANVRLHGIEHFQMIPKKDAPADKPPTESITYKDLPPAGKVQLAAKGGITLSPQDVMMQDLAQHVAKQLTAGDQKGKEQGPEQQPGQ